MRKARTLALYLAPIATVARPVLARFVSGRTPSRAAAHPAAATHTLATHSAPRIHVRDGRNSTSTNWSGYASTGTTYNDVKGSWTQPTASCSSGQTAYSSFWVGIDGDTTNTVEQTGTDADCSSGTPTYYAWYEMYPKFPVNLSPSSYPVLPGDGITAEVSASGGSFTLKIADSTRGWSFTTNQRSRKPARGSAEWIAEAPSSSGGVLPLANFGTVSFSSCTANGAAIGSNPNPDAITMVTSGGTGKAQPSGLGPGGASSTVAWKPTYRGCAQSAP